jgi:hypothetical protein
MIFTQLLGFIDKVIKNSQNGYLGYKLAVKQIESPFSMKDKIMTFKVDIECLDWSAIRNEETKEAYEQYKKELGLFVCFTNLNSNISSIHKIDLNTAIKDELHGRVSQDCKVNIGKAEADETFEFKLTFGDCYGYSKVEQLVNLKIDV